MFEVGNYYSKINTNSIFEQNWLNEHRSCDILHRLHEQIFLDISCSLISSIDVQMTYGTTNQLFDENKVHKFSKKTQFVDVLETREFVG